jgi:hypothetical protein
MTDLNEPLQFKWFSERDISVFWMNQNSH